MIPDVPTRFHAVGRRKTSVARVYLKPGSGKWEVNGRTLGDYFPRSSLVQLIQQPFTVTDTLGAFDVKANVGGGGVTGQAGRCGWASRGPSCWWTNSTGASCASRAC
jgi:ribosomal protein S9